jgi:hAT family C-terminal dimerisation region
LLGLSDDSPVNSQNLVVEVENYLHDWTTGTISLHFWQVSPQIYIICDNIYMVWPQENQLHYPTLFRLALDVLAIQASAVPCERVFSSAKATMALRHNRIKPELMEALQLLKFSVRNGRGLNFTQGLSAEEEMHELEALMEDISRIPRDINAFIAGLTNDLSQLQL